MPIRRNATENVIISERTLCYS